ncbi:hypothetical protein WICMUC_002000 [Wickerhamomyces mucosus]|uniref:Flavin reductase like domain-containing protein n=1 Tax=Wickerhamomyces mucosus TaxID=1378264 RepID=A0A9P8TF02_9ASCO|nr:hypothetical protein WICMUC_002000 [Wickerhamomyces mucosus]
MSLIFKRSNSTVISQFRQAMSSIANQVMILTPTCKVNDISNFQPEILNLRGVTLSSVTSLSINPHPLIQFNLMIPSITSENLHKYDKFALHILNPNDHNIELVKKFSKHREFNVKTSKFDQISPFKGLAKDIDFKLQNVEQLDSVDVQNNTNEKNNLYLPILQSISKVLICEKHQNLLVQDHEIWIGKVLEIKTLNDNYNSKNGGLLNFNRSFHKVGNVI